MLIRSDMLSNQTPKGPHCNHEIHEAGKKTRTICYTYDDSGKLLEVRESDDYYWQIRTYDSYGNSVAVTNGYHDPSRKAVTTHPRVIYPENDVVIYAISSAIDAAGVEYRR